jgi:hypothetical protein
MYLFEELSGAMAYFMPVPTLYYKKEFYVTDMKQFLINIDDPNFDMASQMKLYRYL